MSSVLTTEQSEFMVQVLEHAEKVIMQAIESIEQYLQESAPKTKGIYMTEIYGPILSVFTGSIAAYCGSVNAVTYVSLKQYYDQPGIKEILGKVLNTEKALTMLFKETFCDYFDQVTANFDKISKGEDPRASH